MSELHIHMFVLMRLTACICFAGLHVYGGYGLLGFLAGSYLYKWTNERVIAREVMLMDYIRSHPEDFPVNERKFGKHKA